MKVSLPVVPLSTRGDPERKRLLSKLSNIRPPKNKTFDDSVVSMQARRDLCDRQPHFTAVVILCCVLAGAAAVNRIEPEIIPCAPRDDIRVPAISEHFRVGADI